MIASHKKKRFGQHFLKDKDLSKRIAESLTLNNKEYHILIEIGPGKGSLTDFLIKDKNTELFLVEIDNDLITTLQNKYSLPKQRIIHADFLKLDLPEKFGSRQIGIIGNFPYNISSQIIIKIITNREMIPEMVGMFQKEVAERITAQPGNKSYGRLGVISQAFYHTEYLFTVSREVFHPAPKVESAVIRLTRKNCYHLNCNEELFYKIIKAAFNQRRKKLKNSLSVYQEFFAETDSQILLKRAEELSVEDFVNLARNFSKR